MRRRPTRQEQHQPAKITGLAHAAGRLAHEQGIVEAIDAVAGHARGEQAGTDAVDHDVERRQLGRLHLGQVDARRFGRAVRVRAGAGRREAAGVARGWVAGGEPGDGGDVDDARGHGGAGAFYEEGFEAAGVLVCVCGMGG